MASGAIALVVAALAFGVSSSVLGPKSAIAQHLGFDLTSGTSSFTITSSIHTTPSAPGTYPATSCSGTPALLSPGVTRCVVFSVHNDLKAAISVQSITTALDTTNYAAPPADCSGTNLVLPTFSGSFNVAGGGDATSPGVPVELKDNSAPQDDCENYAYHFVYSGSANYTEVYGTATGLGSSQNPSTTGESVTYTATVTASATSSQDPVPSSPTGAVTFKDNGATICSAPVALTSTGTTTATAQCTVTYATTAGSPHPITASYANTDGNFTNSSASLSQVVTSGSIPTTSVLTSSPNPSSFGSSVTFSDTVSASPTPPNGTTVTFYSCGAGSSTSTCAGTKTTLGTGTLTSGKATFSTTSLPVGTTYVEAVYPATGNYLGSTSNIVAQGVNAIPTTSVLTSSPNPSSYGSSVTFSDTVSASSGTPGGTVTFYSCTTNTCATKTSLGTGTLSGGKATYSTSALPVGTTSVEAIYGASGNYGGSTSNVVSQVLIGVPSVCASGGYGNVINGSPADPFIYGTNGNDLIYAFGTSYWINGFAGNDCIDAGDGNNLIFDGNGNDGVAAGNGSDTVILGNGNDKVSLGNGSDGVETGDGNAAVTVGNGSQSEITVGNGNDTVTVGSGSYNDINLGSGTDTVTIQGSHDDIDGGAGNETTYLGSGTYNTYSGQPHHTNVCHLPTPPSSYHGSAASYYHDTIANCTVVTP
jgi:hypothetical protein